MPVCSILVDLLQDRVPAAPKGGETLERTSAALPRAGPCRNRRFVYCGVCLGGPDAACALERPVRADQRRGRACCAAVPDLPQRPRLLFALVHPAGVRLPERA